MKPGYEPIGYRYTKAIMGKMKIVIMTVAYHPTIGGAELLSQKIAEGLSHRGHEVIVITYSREEFIKMNVGSGKSGKATSEIDFHREIKIVRIIFRAGIEAFFEKFLNERLKFIGKAPLLAIKLVQRYRFGRGVRREINTIQPDAIITLPHVLPHVMLAFDIAARLKIWIGFYPLLHSHDPKFPVERLKRVLKRADAVFTVTDHETSILESYGVEESKLRYSGVGTDFIDGNSAELEDQRTIDVLFLGRITKGKGLDLLLEAIGHLRRSCINFRLVLIGAKSNDSDYYISKFNAILTEDHFIHRSNVSEQERWFWLSRCRVLVFPSKIESFGLVILEAWSARKPVITLDLPIFQEIVDNDVDGKIVSADDALSLAGAIKFFIDDEEAGRRMGLAGFDKIRKKYRWDQVIDRLEWSLPLSIYQK